MENDSNRDAETLRTTIAAALDDVDASIEIRDHDDGIELVSDESLREYSPADGYRDATIPDYTYTDAGHALIAALDRDAMASWEWADDGRTADGQSTSRIIITDVWGDDADDSETEETADTDGDDPSTSTVDSIVPERALHRAAADYDVSPDALRVALRRDLDRNQQMAGEIRDRRPIVHREEDYLVALATDGVTEETPAAVLAVYEAMDDSDADYAAGYPLIVPVDDDTDRDLDGFESVGGGDEDDDHPLMEDDRDLDDGDSRASIRYQTTVTCDGCGVHIGTDGQYCDDCSPPSLGDATDGEGGLGADLRPAADEAGDDDE